MEMLILIVCVLLLKYQVVKIASSLYLQWPVLEQDGEAGDLRCHRGHYDVTLMGRKGDGVVVPVVAALL